MVLLKNHATYHNKQRTSLENNEAQPVQPVQINIYQSNIYRKDLYDDRKVEERQQVLDQPP